MTKEGHQGAKRCGRTVAGHIRTTGQASANYSCKGPHSKYFQFCGTDGLCCNCSTCPHQAKGTPRVSEWMWLSSHKTFILYELGNVNAMSLSHVTEYHFLQIFVKMPLAQEWRATLPIPDG